MVSIFAEVESMIQEGNVEQSVEQTVQRKETLQNILSMLDGKSVGQEKIENQEIHKIDKPNTSKVVECEITGKTVGLKVLVEDTDDDLNAMKSKLKKQLLVTNSVQVIVP